MTTEVSSEVAPAVPESGGAALLLPPWQGLVCCLLAGLLVWGVLEAILPVFELSPELAALTGPEIAPRLEEIQFETALAATRNATLAIAILAFVVGLVMTVAELRLRRKLGRAAWGGLLAGVVAAGIAVLAGMLGDRVADVVKLNAPVIGNAGMSPLAKSILVQVGMLGIMGVGIGLAISLPVFRVRVLLTSVLGCLLGALIAGLVFPLLAGTLLPNMQTEGLVPERGLGRLVWIGLVTGLIGLTATGLGKERKAKVVSA